MRVNREGTESEFDPLVMAGDRRGKVTELEQLKKRINESGMEGVETAHIRDDYEPAGQMMINTLVESGEYVTRKVGLFMGEQKWKIFKSGMEPKS